MTTRRDTQDRDIWISDVLDAWRTLGSTGPEERAAVAAVLGFDGAMLTPAPTPAVMPAGVEPSLAATEPSAAPSAPRASARGQVIPSVAEEDDSAADTAATSYSAGARDLDAEQAAHVAWKPARLPLLQRHWTRHIVSAIASVPIEEGTIDERRLIDAVSRLRPVRRVPRRVRPTLRRGVQLLLDRGEAMQPFTYDARDVITALRTVVGRDRLTVATFEDTPLAGDPTWLRRSSRRKWEPPAAGTPVLLISDLGLSRRYGDVRGAAAAEWLEFASRCRTAGCPAIALVPRREPAWPPAFRRVFTLVPWDHRTTVSTVLRYLRSSTARA